MGVSPTEAAPARLATFYTPATWGEGRAQDQLAELARWPGMEAVAGFPDLHPGRDGPVGAAMLSRRIWPQLIGPDIGCGMALFRLSLPRRKLRLDKAARRFRVLEEGAGADGMGTVGGGNHQLHAACYAARPAGYSPGQSSRKVRANERSPGDTPSARVECRAPAARTRGPSESCQAFPTQTRPPWRSTRRSGMRDEVCFRCGCAEVGFQKFFLNLQFVPVCSWV